MLDKPIVGPGEESSEIDIPRYPLDAFSIRGMDDPGETVFFPDFQYAAAVRPKELPNLPQRRIDFRIDPITRHIDESRRKSGK
jgi:hypothetical protein